MKCRTGKGVVAGVLGAISAVGLLLGMTTDYDKNTKSYWAALGARKLLLACEAYREHPASGNTYPNTLADLDRPEFGEPSFVKDDALTDPWGKPYRYSVVTSAKGEHVVFVWSERVVDGRVRSSGAMRTPGGKTILFGLE